jgi:hypothetical protein
MAAQNIPSKDQCSACGENKTGLKNITLYTASRTDRWDSKINSPVSVKSTTTTTYRGIMKHSFRICKDCELRSSRMAYIYIGTSMGISLMLSILGLLTTSIIDDWRQIICISLWGGPIILILPIYLIMRHLSPMKKIEKKAKKVHGGREFIEVFSVDEYRMKFGKK